MADTTYRLVIRRGPELNKVFELTTPLVTLGRDIINDITISDPEMSRQHCQLIRTDAGYTLQDLSSTNGTFINSEKLEGSRPLKNGDNIGFGETVLVTYTATSLPTLPPKEGTPAKTTSAEVHPTADTNQISVVKIPTTSVPVAEVAAQPAYVYTPPAAVETNAEANRMILFGCGLFTAFCVIGVLMGVLLIDASGRWGDVPVIGGAVESAPIDMENIRTQDFRVDVPQDWNYGRIELEKSYSAVIARSQGRLAPTGVLAPDFGRGSGVLITFVATPNTELRAIATQTLALNNLTETIAESEETTLEIDGETGQSLWVVNEGGDYVRVVAVAQGTNTLFFVALSPAKDRADHEKIFDYMLEHLRFE